VGEKNIESLEDGFVKRAIGAWGDNPNIQVLGNLQAKRLSIISFVIRSGELILHHNFVVALLNDLFGIQARGGCSCAGPYGHRLLGIDLARSMKYHDAINAGAEGIKPGWVRLNFNYFISNEVFEFIIKAVEFIADEGERFLPDYDFCAETGIWRHSQAERGTSLRLTDIAYCSGRMQYRSEHITEPESALAEYLERAAQIAAERDKAVERTGRCVGADGSEVTLSAELEPLRWFPLPGESP